MIKHLKALGHKGIKEVELGNLGQLNVICGKNSSGKSSILESFTIPAYRSIGFSMDESSGLAEKIKSFTGNIEIERWFNASLTRFFNNGNILYDKEVAKSAEYFFNEQNKNSRLPGYLELPHFKQILSSFIKPRIVDFKTTLIPPKRTLKTGKDIDFKTTFLTSGEGIVNHLFFLKNQEIDSEPEKKFKKIHFEFKRISNHSFNIIPDNENKISVSFKDSHGKWRRSDECGLGLSDLLILLTVIISTNDDLYLIEEPENHLHADLQRRLLGFFKSQDKQFIISTHSDVFINHAQVDKVFYCWYNGKVQLSDQTSLSKIVSELGFSTSEKLTSDALILVEGPTDTPVVQKLFELLGTSNDFNMKFWPLGGDIMASLDLTVFEGRQNTFAIIDQAPKSGKHRRAFKKNCNDNSIDCLQLDRYAIENYFTLKAIKGAFPSQVPKSVTALVSGEKIDKQIGFEQKGKSIKQRTPTILKHMTLEDFEGTDLLSFIRKIDSKLRANTQQPNN